MRNFRQSTIRRQSLLTCDDAVSPRDQYLVGFGATPTWPNSGSHQTSRGMTGLYKYHRGAMVRQSKVHRGEQLETVLNALDVLALEAPADTLFGELRARLERAGQTIGANDLLIAAHALTLGHTVVTDNVREFSRVKDLRIENWLR